MISPSLCRLIHWMINHLLPIKVHVCIHVSNMLHHTWTSGTLLYTCIIIIMYMYCNMCRSWGHFIIRGAGVVFSQVYVKCCHRCVWNI